MILTWRDLFSLTLRNPFEAAQMILSVQLDRRELYMALIAAAALNSVIMGLSTLIFPLPQGWPSFIAHPLSYFVIAAGGLVLFSHVLTWCGRALGGTGVLDDLLKLMIWVQVVRVVLQAIGLVIAVSLTPLAAIYSLITTGLSLWIVLNSIQAGHRLPSIGNAAAVLFVSFVGLIVGLSLLLALLGGGALVGVNPNV